MPQTASLVKEFKAIDGEMTGLLWAVNELSAQCKRVLTLRKIYGWEHDRIATHLDIDRYEVEMDLRACAQSIARYYEHQ